MTREETEWVDLGRNKIIKESLVVQPGATHGSVAVRLDGKPSQLWVRILEKTAADSGIEVGEYGKDYVPVLWFVSKNGTVAEGYNIAVSTVTAVNDKVAEIRRRQSDLEYQLGVQLDEFTR
jgi:hypothetical protein